MAEGLNRVRNLCSLAFAAVLTATDGFAAERPAPGDLFAYPHVIEAENGDAVEMTAGQLFVAENRDNDTGNIISIPFYRLASTAEQPAAPVFLLAGGPGGSWIERFHRAIGQEEALFYRELADVVILDQRGAGGSRPSMSCRETVGLPLDRTVPEDEYAANLRTLAADCRAAWEAAGIDLSSYTTVQSADDVNELRKALGYDRITLVAGSYGSHLALTLMRRHPDSSERAMLRGLEGPDHTWDMPSGTLGALSRIAAAAEAYRPLQPHIPEGGLIEAFRTVQDRLKRNPEVVTIERDGKHVDVTVGKHDVQKTHRQGANRSGAWPARIISLHRGDYAQLAQETYDHRRAELSDAGPMFYMMDCATSPTPRSKAALTAHSTISTSCGRP